MASNRRGDPELVWKMELGELEMFDILKNLPFHWIWRGSSRPGTRLLGRYFIQLGLWVTDEKCLINCC